MNYDVAVIGGGPAGLTAATYLARFHRRAIVIDGNDSRARWIPTSHNIPGFTSGIGGDELLSKLRSQAEVHGVSFFNDRVIQLDGQQGHFSLRTGQQTLTSRFVLLATGVKDHFPKLPGVEEAVLRSVMRLCPICDGFEATGKRIAVLGDGPLGMREAQFLVQTYSKSVCYLNLDGTTDSDLAHLRALGISVRDVSLENLCIEDNALTICSASTRPEKFDVFYSALGCTPQRELAETLGATLDDKSALLVSSHQETSVGGLYAAGDIVRGLNQVVVAAAEGAIAATDIHNRLRS